MARSQKLFSASNYILSEGRQYGEITNAQRVIAAAYVLQGVPVKTVAAWYEVSQPTVKNWLKTLHKNNPNLG